MPIDSYQVSDVAEFELLGPEEARNGSACTTDNDESLVRDI